MPIYSYECNVHGEFDLLQPMGAGIGLCPDCGAASTRLPTSPVSIRVHEAERQPLGTGSKGRYVSSKETGGLPIFIPSFGAMEQAEVDYVAEGAIEKEKARVRKGQKRDNATPVKIGALMDLAHQTKPGQRAKAVKEAIKATSRQI